MTDNRQGLGVWLRSAAGQQAGEVPEKERSGTPEAPSMEAEGKATYSASQAVIDVGVGQRNTRKRVHDEWSSMQKVSSSHSRQCRMCLHYAGTEEGKDQLVVYGSQNPSRSANRRRIRTRIRQKVHKVLKRRGRTSK